MAFPQTPLKYVTTYNDEVLPESFDPDGLINYIEISDVNASVGITGSTTVKFSEAPSRARRVIRRDDVLISTVRTYLRAIASADRDHDGFIASTGFCILRPSKVHPGFLKFAASNPEFVEEVIARSTGISYPAINASDLVRLSIPLPSWTKQESITKFLDRETAQIDELIGKQERLIELLAEKRQSIITHAVTKGLDPTAPTKPSGIPWLGHIPTHWAQKPMCHFMAGRVDYRGATPKKTDDGIFLVTAKNVRKGFIDYSASAEYIAAEDYDSVMSRGIPAIGDILMTMEAPLGNFALIDDPKVALAQRVIKFRPKAELLPAFAIYAANSPYFQSQLEERATGSTALGIKASKLIELRLTAPSREEQQGIVDFLDTALGRIDGLTQRAKTAISLLRERRSALISAAVTGKIDVQEGAA